MRNTFLLAVVVLVGSVTNEALAQGRCMGGSGGTGTGTGVTATGVTSTGLVGGAINPNALYQMALQQAYMQQMVYAQQQEYLREEAQYAEQLAEKRERKLAVLRARRERETANWASSRRAPAYPSLDVNSKNESRTFNVSSSARQATPRQ